MPDKPLILAVDTALSACSVALHCGQKTLASAYEEIGRGHAERLIPMMDEVMGSARDLGHDFEDVRAIAVTVGPGAFTGLRIGLSTGRALGLALGCPVVPVTTFEAVAVASLIHDPVAVGATLAVLHDARRGELYVQLIRVDGYNEQGFPQLSFVGDAAAISLADVVPGIPTDVTVAMGSGVGLVADALTERGIAVRSADAFPDAKWIACIADEMLRSGAALEPARPLYLRAPDAKLPGGVSLQ